MTSRLDRLEGRGLIQRSLDPADRRSFRVALTEPGLILIDRVLEEHAANLRGIMAPMSQRQIAALEAGLRSLLDIATATPSTESVAGDDSSATDSRLPDGSEARRQ